MSGDDGEARFRAYVEAFGRPYRSPILRTPAHECLAYEDLFFPSADGTPLEAWYVPREGADELVIVSRPLAFSRYGLPAHIEPWKSSFGDNNDFEVNLVPDLRILHEAGYDVLAYDFRNFGHGAAANGGVRTAGIYEARDVLGSLAFAQTDPRLRGKAIGLFSRCLGANAAMFAFAAQADAFRDVRCLVAPLPITVRYIVERSLAMMGMADRMDEFDRAAEADHQHRPRRHVAARGGQVDDPAHPHLPGPARYAHAARDGAGDLRQRRRREETPVLGRGHRAPLRRLSPFPASSRRGARLVRRAHRVKDDRPTTARG